MSVVGTIDQLFIPGTQLKKFGIYHHRGGNWNYKRWSLRSSLREKKLEYYKNVCYYYPNKHLWSCVPATVLSTFPHLTYFALCLPFTGHCWYFDHDNRAWALVFLFAMLESSQRWQLYCLMYYRKEHCLNLHAERWRLFINLLTHGGDTSNSDVFPVSA